MNHNLVAATREIIGIGQINPREFETSFIVQAEVPEVRRSRTFEFLGIELYLGTQFAPG